MGRVLVTGASGFVGSYVVRRLVAEGNPVRGLFRHPPPDGYPGEVLLGDLTDAAVLRRATAGIDTIIHLAACARVASRDPREFHRVNVEGTARLLEAAGRARVRRLVHVSTVLTLPPYRSAPQGERFLTEYESTKAAGERLVERYAATGSHAVIVHPTRIYGPGPLHDANGATVTIALYLGGRFRFRLADGEVRANYVHADDVARGIILAARRGRPGAHYVLGGEDASFRELLDRVSCIAGVRRSVLPLPIPLAMVAGFLSECWGALGGQPRISRGWIRSFLEDRRVDSDLANRELGYQARSLDLGLRETIDWLFRQRHVRVAA
jgi:nucleoside-diphosphate-sugar epimerase